MAVLDESEDLARCQATRHRMRNARSESGIEAIHINGEIDRGVVGDVLQFGQRTGQIPGEHETKSVMETHDLLGLLIVERADSELGYRCYVVHLEEPRGHAGVRMGTVLEFAVEVRVGVDLDDVDEVTDPSK